MINAKDLRELIIRPVLEKLQVHDNSVVELLFITALDQSKLGERLNTDTGNGIYGMGLQTHHMIWDKYLAADPKHLNLLMMHFAVNPTHDLYFRLTHDLWYATAMAYFFYRMNHQQIDGAKLERGTPEDLAEIYNDIYAQKALTKAGAKELLKLYTTTL